MCRAMLFPPICAVDNRRTEVGPLSVVGQGDFGTACRASCRGDMWEGILSEKDTTEVLRS
jgi:hypothetical protein